MGRYVQKISLRPYSDTDIWVGWELEGQSGVIPGLTQAEGYTAAQLDDLGVTEFQTIPAEYLDTGDFLNGL